MMWWHGPAMNTWGYALTTLGMVLFWQLAVFGAIVVVRHLGRLNESVPERPLPPSYSPSAPPAASSTSRSSEDIRTGVDRSEPAATSQRPILRLV
ncbi:hypothetical protein FHX44_116450 [Pseudonocardia hierapolitana]|uniref:Uncharacterized protein n=1 Tax=Pseudonocardia hierapolitana TaxID=1128676 RepID=A0A561T087_9PSEU|nr:hypothetical protein [Pseudonocardia hierapolitana]TWF80507.1 hypothetical protein FHX44_116450 [Pseudonocardia hierapolitana]